MLSVNVGQVAPYSVGTGNRSAIVKAPVKGPVAVRGVNLEGDDQADRRVHGGPQQAVYAYARESYEWREGELGRELAPGTFGENLTAPARASAGPRRAHAHVGAAFHGTRVARARCATERR